MPTVNWERLSGEQVQEFVAALILLRWPHGNFITPSRGDRGVDIRVAGTERSFDVYQVKRYSRPLTSAQWRDVANSWTTFVEQTRPTLAVQSWKLVMPWNPTNEALDRFATMTAGVDVDVEWVGRTQLDTWAAENPALVAYYFGDGADRLQDLLTQALFAGSTPHPSGDVLSAATFRAVALQAALDDVDPFYRYQVEVRDGHIDSPQWLTDVTSRSGFVMVRGEQVTSTQYAVTYIYPRSAESAALRPIRQDITLLPEADSEGQNSVERFINYGAPFSGVRGVVTQAEGPPGTTELGDGIFSFFLAADEPGEALPPLDIRAVRHPDREVLAAVDACGVQRSMGLNRNGVYLKATDPSGCFTLTFLIGVQGEPSTFRLDWGEFAGKEPATVVRSLKVFHELGEHVGIEIGIRGGGQALTPLFRASDSEAQKVGDWFLPFFAALETIQRHTLARVVIPDASEITPKQMRDATNAARLLEGEELKGPWAFLDTTITAPQDLPDFASGEFAMVTEEPLVVVLGTRRIETDSLRRTVYPTVRIDGNPGPSQLEPGDQLRLLPGENPEALQVAVRADASLSVRPEQPHDDPLR